MICRSRSSVTRAQHNWSNRRPDWKGTKPVGAKHSKKGWEVNCQSAKENPLGKTEGSLKSASRAQGRGWNAFKIDAPLISEDRTHREWQVFTWGRLDGTWGRDEDELGRGRIGPPLPHPINAIQKGVKNHQYGFKQWLRCSVPMKRFDRIGPVIPLQEDSICFRSVECYASCSSRYDTQLAAFSPCRPDIARQCIWGERCAF